MKHVQFKLTDEQYERLIEQALEGESPGVTAKRLLLGIPVGKGESVRVTGYSGTPEQIAKAVAARVQAKKKPATTIEQERAQAAERYVVETPKLLRGWPAEVRSQDEIDFDDVPVIGAPPPDEPVESPSVNSFGKELRESKLRESKGTK